MIATFSERKKETAKSNLIPQNAKIVETLIKGKGISKYKIPEKSGVYIFWWEGDLDLLKEKLLCCLYEVKGKASYKKMIEIKFTSEWIAKATHNGKICLYAGKSTNLRDRISKHLKLGTEDIWGLTKRNSGIKPNTVSQMRIGLETVFSDKPSMLNELKSAVSISWAEMDKYSESINRFFLEDEMVSLYYPLFNIDVER